MNQTQIHLSEEQLAEMDRILAGEKIRGRLWLQHAVAIYKDLLLQRQGQLDRIRSLRVVQGGRSARSFAYTY